MKDRDVDPHMRGRVGFSTVAGAPESDKSVRGDLFGRGVQVLFRNYLAGREVGGGLAALADDDRFLRGVRRLTDTVYASAMDRLGVDRIVDVSPGNARVIEVIRAVYPDAFDELGTSGAATGHQAYPVRELGAPPIFVVGVPRSGTTWLQHMLKAHPAIDGPEQETSIFLSLRALHDNIGRPAAVGVAGLIERPAFIAALREFAGSLFADYLTATDSGASRFLEKTPLHAEHLALMADLFPEASIVSIHRDGRDVVRSLLEMDAATDDVVAAATIWADITARVEAAVPSLRHARDERYEDLLEEPVGRVAELLEWLGLAADDEVRERIARRASERVSQYNTTGDVGTGKWRALPARTRRAVYHHAGDRLLSMGYVTADELRRGRARWRR
jgi:hypothetical protein